MTAPRINSPEHRAAQAEVERFGRAVRELDAQARARRIMRLNDQLIQAVCDDIAGVRQ